jgi:hypothetical protein
MAQLNLELGVCVLHSREALAKTTELGAGSHADRLTDSS